MIETWLVPMGTTHLGANPYDPAHAMESSDVTAEIRTEPFQVVLYGASKHHEPPACYGDDIRTLLDRVWPVLKQHNIPNRGLNHVIYSQGDEVFAGVEAEVADAQALGLRNEKSSWTNTRIPSTSDPTGCWAAPALNCASGSTRKAVALHCPSSSATATGPTTNRSWRRN